MVRPGKLPVRLAVSLRNLADERQNGEYDATAAFDEADATRAQERSRDFYREVANYLVEVYGFSRDEVAGA